MQKAVRLYLPENIDASVRSTQIFLPGSPSMSTSDLFLESTNRLFAMMFGIKLLSSQQALSDANRELLFSVIDHIADHANAEIRHDNEALSVAAATLMNQEYSLDTRISLLKGLVGGRRLPAIAVYDQEGKWIDTVVPTGSEAALFPSSLPSSLRMLADKQERVLSKAHWDPQKNTFISTIVVQSQSSDTTWYLASHFDFSRIQGDLEKIGQQRLGQGHSLMLIDSSFRVLADSQIEGIGTTASPENLRILSGIDPAAINKGILLFGENDEGENAMLGALRSLDGIPWAVAAEIPRRVAFHSIEKIRWLLWIVVGMAATLAVGIGILLAKRISAPLQALAHFAGELASRRFDKRIEVHTSDELSVLGQALSNAAQELEISDKRIADEIRIRSDLGRYLPAPLVDRIVEHEQDMCLGGERSEITVLFADVVGFTPLAETHSAEEIVTLLNELFTILTEIVFRHQGTVDKFIGDSVMAFWGAPSPIVLVQRERDSIVNRLANC